MQTLNLQAPKVVEADVPSKTKGTQLAKKPSSKKSSQAKGSSFKEMVDQSAKQEEQIKNKTTQSPTQQSDRAQEATSKIATERTNKTRRTEDCTDEREMVAFAHGSPQTTPIEASWLQSALQGQNVQEQTASTLAESLGEEEIAFLKADPIFDDSLSVSQEDSSFLATQLFTTQETDQTGLYTNDTSQQITAELLDANKNEEPTLNDGASLLLQEEGSVESALFEAQDIGGKQKDKTHVALASLSEEALHPLGDLSLAVQNATDIVPQTGGAQNSVDVMAAQNELLGGVFTVTDLRPASQREEHATELLADGKTQAGEGRAELSLELSLPQTTHTATPTPVKEASGVPSFQRLLSEQLRSGAPDFAKAGSIVLRGENEGTIKLALRPESLGNVKINLQLSDNVITGKIAVASKEAFEAFKQNIGALRQAFSDSGFEGAEFTLSYFDSSSGFAQESGGQNDGRFLSNKAYADYVSGENGLSDTGEAQVFAFDTDKKVNVVA